MPRSSAACGPRAGTAERAAVPAAGSPRAPRSVIIRPRPGGQLFITQPDHAALAARIMARWELDDFPSAARRAAILLAIAQHDNGWREVDTSPVLDADTGEALDFVHAPDAVRRGVWPRGVARMPEQPYAAALIAQHALHIYRRYRGRPAWDAFFAELETARDQHLAAAAAAPDALERDYAFVRLGDALSLTFCNGWTEPQVDESGCTWRLLGSRLIVDPDPFGGATVPLDVAARELPDAAFASPADAARRFAAAPIVHVTGTASGSDAA